MKIPIPEASVKKAVQDYLEIHHHLYLRVQPVRLIGKNGQIRAIRPMLSQRGAPDFIVIRNHLSPVAIETKSSVGKLSKDQENWKRLFVLTGGCYVLARSTDDLSKAGI